MPPYFSVQAVRHIEDLNDPISEGPIQGPDYTVVPGLNLAGWRFGRRPIPGRVRIRRTCSSTGCASFRRGLTGLVRGLLRGVALRGGEWIPGSAIAKTALDRSPPRR